jgi:hypothetical protein
MAAFPHRFHEGDDRPPEKYAPLPRPCRAVARVPLASTVKAGWPTTASQPGVRRKTDGFQRMRRSPCRMTCPTWTCEGVLTRVRFISGSQLRLARGRPSVGLTGLSITIKAAFASRRELASPPKEPQPEFSWASRFTVLWVLKMPAEAVTREPR